MPKGKGKQRKRIRKRRWDEDRDVDAVTREPRRIRGRESGIGAPVTIEKRFEDCFQDVEANGLVISPYGVLAFVLIDGEEQLCRVAESLTDGRTSVLAPGDEVRVERDGDEYLVTAVRPRHSKLSRPDTLIKEREQVFAANIDLLVVVASAVRPAFKTGVVDRYLIAAEMGDVSVLLCLNKIDLMEQEPPPVSVYEELGLPVVRTSCETGEGIHDLRRHLVGKTSVFSGQSGVGKSSLLNALSPDLDIAIQNVSRITDKGRHTTSSSRLYILDDDIRIIDTPGIRQLGLWGVQAAELDFYFPELAERAPRCRFRDCVHIHEPGCAIREAVEHGEIPRLRYQSYRWIRESLAEEDRYGRPE